MTKVDRGALVSSLITEIAVPEVLAVIRRHHAATGELPTEAHIREQLAADADRIVGAGERYLAEHGAARSSSIATAAELDAPAGSIGE